MHQLTFAEYEASGGEFSPSEHQRINELLLTDTKPCVNVSAALPLQVKSMLMRSGSLRLDEIREHKDAVKRTYVLLRLEGGKPWGTMCDQRLLYEILLFFGLLQSARLHKESNTLVL